MILDDFLLPQKRFILPLAEYVPNSFASATELALGIFPGSFPNLSALLIPERLSDITETFGMCNIFKHGVFICGIVPGSVAYSSGKVFLGDYLVSINNFAVTLDSLEESIRHLYDTGFDSVEITTQSLRIDKLSKSFGKSSISDQVVRFGDNNHWTGLCNSLSLYPFAAFWCEGKAAAESDVKVC